MKRLHLAVIAFGSLIAVVGCENDKSEEYVPPKHSSHGSLKHGSEDFDIGDGNAGSDQLLSADKPADVQPTENGKGKAHPSRQRSTADNDDWTVLVDYTTTSGSTFIPPEPAPTESPDVSLGPQRKHGDVLMHLVPDPEQETTPLPPLIMRTPLEFTGDVTLKIYSMLEDEDFNPPKQYGDCKDLSANFQPYAVVNLSDVFAEAPTGQDEDYKLHQVQMRALINGVPEKASTVDINNYAFCVVSDGHADGVYFSLTKEVAERDRVFVDLATPTKPKIYVAPYSTPRQQASPPPTVHPRPTKSDEGPRSSKHRREQSA